tara:strand:+ start:14441 stop:14962 length:522 start_codon:yes stop_codon:yes gene_type:complete
MKTIIILLSFLSFLSHAKTIAFNSSDYAEVIFMNKVIADLDRLHNEDSRNSNGCLFLRGKGIFSTKKWNSLDEEYKRELGECSFIEYALDNDLEISLVGAHKWIEENSTHIREEYSQASYIRLMEKIVRDNTADEDTIEWRHNTLCAYIKQQSVLEDEYNKEAIASASPLCNQ